MTVALNGSSAQMSHRVSIEACNQYVPRGPSNFNVGDMSSRFDKGFFVELDLGYTRVRDTSGGTETGLLASLEGRDEEALKFRWA